MNFPSFKFLFLCLRVLVLTALAWAGGLNFLWADDENPNDYLHTRTYIGILGLSTRLDNSGIFSGQDYSLVETPYEVDPLPVISQGLGYGFVVGHREEAYALEISYWESQHTVFYAPISIDGTNGDVNIGNSLSAQGTATYYSINVDFKRYFLTELQLQPFLALGVSYPWIDIPDASANGSAVGTTTLAGLGFDLGIGAEYYFQPEFSVEFEACQRWASFDSVRGVSGGAFQQINEVGSVLSDEASGLNLLVGTTIGFE